MSTTKNQKVCHTEYLGKIFGQPDGLKITAEEVVSKLRRQKVDFDAILVTGISGLLIGPLVSKTMKKLLIVVRKRGVHCHASRNVEGLPRKSFRYIILDDFISSGRTVARMITEVKSECSRRTKTTFIGFVSYGTINTPTIWKNSKEVIETDFYRNRYINAALKGKYCMKTDDSIDHSPDAMYNEENEKT